jgi:dihydrofolate synthase/folylpolyglutamate synthase
VNFASSSEVFDWLSHFENLERSRRPKAFGLDKMRVLARIAGNPERCAPVIHVAGSKGKGSVTGMISAILSAGGFKTARYTSPHITEFRERITMGDAFFDEAVYAEAGNELFSVEEAYRLHNSSGSGQKSTFFELLTLYFFLCARNAGCTAMAVETGMGGRLDATTIVDPLAALINIIELEHTEILGDTLEAIAAEKAGIIKDNRPLILAEQKPEALRVFQRCAAEKNAPLYYLPECASIENLRLSPEGSAFSLRAAALPTPLDLSIRIPGAVQAKNVALAVIAVKTAFPALRETAIQSGLANFSLPARFERIRDDPPLIIDGAHTPQSIAACIETFSALYGNDGNGGILIFGCAIDKDAAGMARLLTPLFSHIIITTPGTYKESSPEEVYGVFRNTAAASEVLFIKETNKALEKALLLGKERRLPILATGSFYLAAEIRGIEGSA